MSARCCIWWLAAIRYKRRLRRYYGTTTVRLAAQSITPQSGVAATATWPCFQSGDAGKSIVVDGQGQFQIWLNDTTKTVDATWPFGQSAFITTISTVSGPTQATLGAALPSHLDECSDAPPVGANKRRCDCCGRSGSLRAEQAEAVFQR